MVMDAWTHVHLEAFAGFIADITLMSRRAPYYDMNVAGRIAEVRNCNLRV